jgi:hypothetical protein
VDLAGGGGRHAVVLARHGLAVTVVDLSAAALEVAAATAAGDGVEVGTLRADLETGPPPAGPWDVALIFHFLRRDLPALVAPTLAPGGWLLFAAATRRNLERHDRPPLRYLLEEGEAPSLFPGLDIVLYTEGWLEEGRHEARVAARRPR